MVRKNRRGRSCAICFPIVSVVDKEVDDVAEDFEQDSIVERHDGDV